MGDLTKNFSSDEFRCPCCNQSKMNPEFMERLQKLRDAFGSPFSPVKGGGYRCEYYNGSITGAHVEGRAIDPNIANVDYHKFIKLAFELGFTGIGVKNKGGRFQLHLDDTGTIPGIRPRPYVWTY
jgi:zinc D-Ala-D-Ala carboxypeptidase